MIKKIGICLLVFACIAQVNAQADKRQKRERMKAKKVAYITDTIQLTAEQSENL